MAFFGANSIHFAFSFSAIMLCITVVIFSFIHQRTEKTQNKIFLSLVGVTLLNSICELITNYVEPLRFKSYIYYYVMYSSRLLYFVFHAALAPLFFYYVAVVCGAVSKANKRQYFIFSSLFVINELTVFANPFTKWLFYFDSDRVYTRSWAIYGIYIAAAVYFALAIRRLIISWEAVVTQRKIAMFYFLTLVLVGVVVQLIWIDLKVELFTESLGMLGIMLSIENEDDKLDIETRVYNRRALENDLKSYFINKRTLQLFCIKVNTEIAERTVGTEAQGAIRAAVAEFLKTMFTRYNIYVTAADTLIVTVFDLDSEMLYFLAQKISDRFDKPWVIADTDVMLNAVVMSANIPERITSISDAMYMADSPVPHNNEKKVLTDSDLDYLLRRAAVEKAIKRGLEEHTFEVYYQPTYCLDEGFSLHGAEALLRLHDSVIGNVYPTEFIPIAEKTGLIDDLDDFVLGDVCALIKTGLPSQCGMDNINVNLSVIQCMRHGFVDHIKQIVNGYGIDKSLINFEITETVAPGDYRILSRTVGQLKREGFKFSMDDYGTGYSNIQSIFSLDFDIVKIDKSILWSAEKGDLGRIILENSVRMIKQMDRKILVEGVETRKQLDLLSTMDVDYLQGYYFSRPIPKADFIDLIQNAARK